MQEHRCLGRQFGGVEGIGDQLEPIGHQHGAGREITHEEPVTLLGELGRGADIDHQRHLTLLAHLRHRERGRGIERTDDGVHAAIDDALALGAGDVRIGLDVDMHQLYPVSEIGQHLGGEQRAAMAALPRRRKIARARQQHGDLDGLLLGPHDPRRPKERGNRHPSGHHMAPARPCRFAGHPRALPWWRDADVIAFSGRVETGLPTPNANEATTGRLAASRFPAVRRQCVPAFASFSNSAMMSLPTRGAISS